MTADSADRDTRTPHITVRNLTMGYGDFILMRDLDFTVYRGDVFAIMGGSGCGKSTLMRILIGLKAPHTGTVSYADVDFWSLSESERDGMMRRFGVLYQSGALWSSKTLAENISLPMEVHTDLDKDQIRELVASLRQCVADYVSRFPDNPEHPLFSRRSEAFDFSASWSVRLARRGYHTMHVHPMGWISSAYYVQVPDEVSESDAHGGGIKFGEPDIDIGEYGQARRRIQPQVGRLVLFPSYMWHGTVPFESDAPRMTVAFDVVPEN